MPWRQICRRELQRSDDQTPPGTEGTTPISVDCGRAARCRINSDISGVRARGRGETRMNLCSIGVAATPKVVSGRPAEEQ
jgi:hypothetical protein